MTVSTTELLAAAPTALKRAQQRAAGRLAMAGFGSAAVMLSLVVSVTYRRPPWGGFLHGPGWLEGWFHRDAGWYYRIVKHGYFFDTHRQSAIAFFPSYPLVVRAANTIFRDVQVTGTIVTVIAGVFAFRLYGRWAAVRVSRRTTAVAIALLVLYPFSFYLYGPMYSDSLFLLSVLGAFTALEEGHALLAGAIGIAATAGRPVGLALSAGLMVRSLELVTLPKGSVASVRQLVTAAFAAPRRRVTTALAMTGVSVLGLVAWCTYLHFAFGDALGWVHAEKSWGQPSGLHTWLKFSFFDTMAHGRDSLRALLIVQAVICVLGLMVLPTVRRLFGLGYAVYAGGILGIALVGTKDLMGTGRYIIAAFPILVAAAHIVVTRSGGRRWPTFVLLAFSAVAIVTASVFYSRGYPVS